MGQVKKEAVRKAILESALKLFQERGYANTPIPAIAKMAGVSSANIYVYFPSKLLIFFAIFEPWFHRQIDRLEGELDEIPDSEARIRKILHAIWYEIPMRDRGFPNNLIQALSTGSASEGYERDLLFWSEAKVAGMIDKSLPEAELSDDELSYLCRLIFMAHDGFAMNFSIRGPSPRIDGVIDLTVDMILSFAGRRSNNPASK